MGNASIIFFSQFQWLFHPHPDYPGFEPHPASSLHPKRGLSQDHAGAVSCRHLNHHEGRATHRIIAWLSRFRWRPMGPSAGHLPGFYQGFLWGANTWEGGNTWTSMNKHEQADMKQSWDFFSLVKQAVMWDRVSPLWEYNQSANKMS